MLAGVCSVVLLLPIYIRLKSLVAVPIGHICPVISEGLIALISGILGCVCLLNRNNMVTFAFILTLVALMNLQVILSLKSGMLPEKSRPWFNSEWSQFTNEQRNYVQGRLGCCGLETTTDRPGTICRSNINCMDKLITITKNMRNLSQKLLVTMFFVETIALSIFALLRFGKK